MVVNKPSGAAHIVRGGSARKKIKTFVCLFLRSSSLFGRGRSSSNLHRHSRLDGVAGARDIATGRLPGFGDRGSGQNGAADNGDPGATRPAFQDFLTERLRRLQALFFDNLILEWMTVDGRTPPCEPGYVSARGRFFPVNEKTWMEEFPLFFLLFSVDSVAGSRPSASGVFRAGNS